MGLSSSDAPPPPPLSLTSSDVKPGEYPFKRGLSTRLRSRCPFFTQTFLTCPSDSSGSEESQSQSEEKRELPSASR